MLRKKLLELAFLLMDELVCFRYHHVVLHTEFLFVSLKCFVPSLFVLSLTVSLSHGLFCQNDHDPSKLIAETPCKLMRYLVPDNSHVDADMPYAEVEVMKMCMPLLSPASGIIQFEISEGQAMQVCSICDVTCDSVTKPIIN